MTPQELYKENLPAIQAFIENKPIELSVRGTNRWKAYNGTCPNFKSENFAWRPKAWTLSHRIPGFRALVDGEEWHRQDFTEDMLTEGWRPLLMGEKEEKGDAYFHLPLNESVREWRTVPCTRLEVRGAAPHDSFNRTQRPLPPLKKTVPLESSDIGPSDIFRLKDGIGVEYQWKWKSLDRIGLEKGSEPYTYLMGNYEILRPGQDWQPCSKEVEFTE